MTERIDLTGDEVIRRLREIAYERGLSGRDTARNELDSALDQLLAEYGSITTAAQDAGQFAGPTSSAGTES